MRFKQFYKFQSKRTVVVGLNLGHDGGSAIAIDGVIQCAISEERLNRRRYSPGYLNSLFYCLNALNLAIKDISSVVVSSYGAQLPNNYQNSLKALGVPSEKFITVDHHLSHAFGAYFLSPFDDALIIVMDGQGNGDDTESYYIGDGQRIEKIGGNSIKRDPAKGIGRTYEAFTNFLGWIDQESGKTMGLSGYGDSSSIYIPLFELKGTEVASALDHKYEKGVIEFAKRYSLDFGHPYSNGLTPQSCIVAAYVQRETERIIVELVAGLVKKTGKRKVCLAGGVALNCNANARLIKNNIVDDLFILPPSSDKGQCVGNALYGSYKLLGYLPRNPLYTDHLGRDYSEKEILVDLHRETRRYEKYLPTKDFTIEKSSSITKTVAKLLAEGSIVGWFQGKSELSPRALGHRSILCDPRKAEMKDLLNKIKGREKFRPFAPSCLSERVSDFFEFNKPSPYMLFAVPAKTKAIKKIPAVTHVDSTSRIQTVVKETDDRFYSLIKEFCILTGIPMLLNTSFNDKSPIVETPADALSIFLATELDYLAIGDYLVYKKSS